MTQLVELASILRSKNAGPLYVTFDVMFDSKQSYERVKNSNVLNNTLVSKLYDVPGDEIDIVLYDIVNSLKITVPRKIISGGIGDDDVYGCQQQYALANVLIP